MRSTVTNIRTPSPLSGGPLEDAHNAMKKFSHIFLAEKKGGNKIIKGLIRLKTSWEKLKWACGNYRGTCVKLGVLRERAKGRKWGNQGG